MRHYQLSQNLSLDIKPSPMAFKLFVGKTNRLKLLSMSVCGIALDFYLARQWDYPSWDQEQDFLAESEITALSGQQAHH